MYFPDDVWNEIKMNIFHNILYHGKHLKNVKENQNFNNVMREFKLKYFRTVKINGPRISYSTKLKKYNYVTFNYGMPCPSYYSRRSNYCFIVKETLFNFSSNHLLINHYYIHKVL